MKDYFPNADKMMEGLYCHQMFGEGHTIKNNLENTKGDYITLFGNAKIEYVEYKGKKGKEALDQLSADNEDFNYYNVAGIVGMTFDDLDLIKG